MKIYKSADYIKKGNVAVFESQKSVDEEHTHDYLEIVYCQKGAARQYVNREKYEMKRGDMLFINRGAMHRHFAPFDNFQYINICVVPEKSDSDATLKAALPFMETHEGKNLLSRDSEMVSFDKEELLTIEGLIQSFIREHDGGSLYFDKISDNYVNILFFLFLRKMHVVPPKATGRAVMNEIIEYLEVQLHRDISLAEVAEKYHYNKFYFSRIFKEKMGEGFTDYVNRRRIAKAKELLAETNLTVDKIMESVGFNSRSMFYHSFKRFVGMTTVEYREKFGNKEN